MAAKKGISKSLRNPVMKTLIRMKKERASLKVIGRAINISPERVRQLTLELTDLHGAKLFKTSVHWWTPPEVAKKLQISLSVIKELCDAGGISCRAHIGKRQKKFYLISDTGVRQLKRKAGAKKQKTCPICKEKFVRKENTSKTCSAKCGELWRTKQRKGYAKTRPTIDSLTGWQQQVWKKLEKRKPLKNERWITFPQAKLKTGLTSMQLRWLKLRNIVTTLPNRKKKWRGKPTPLFAESEMRIIKKVLSTYDTSSK
jgi:hypothetical protein